MARGKFITLEGGEGAGKSTQAARLVAWLHEQGLQVVQTREPGGSPGAEAIRGLVLNGPPERWSPLTEALLMYAARADHLERTIRPALASGAWVVCDRFADSSRAYQGRAGEVGSDFIEQLDAAVVGSDQPDLTLVFDLPVEIGLSRALARATDGAETRFESKGPAFHAALREAFTAIVADHPERCRAIDAGGDPDAVFDQVRAAVEPILP